MLFKLCTRSACVLIARQTAARLKSSVQSQCALLTLFSRCSVWNKSVDAL